MPRTIIVCFLVLYPLLFSAQPTQNPFDLEHRVRSMMLMLRKDSTGQNVYSNPFDIPNKREEIRQPGKKLNKRITKREFTFRAFKTKPDKFFGLLIGLAILLAFVSTTSRNIYGKILHSLKNEGTLKTFHREANNFFVFPLFLLYLFWLTNLGIFVYFLIQSYGIQRISNGAPIGLWLCIGVIFLAFILKHLIWYCAESLLPLKKQLGLFHFGIIQINILLGIALFPINIFLLYVPAGLMKFTVITGIVAIITMYLYRAFVGFLVAYKYIIGNIFHFLLYFCTVEIAPFVIILKYLANKTGIQ